MLEAFDSDELKQSEQSRNVASILSLLTSNEGRQTPKDSDELKQSKQSRNVGSILSLLTSNGGRKTPMMMIGIAKKKYNMKVKMTSPGETKNVLSVHSTEGKSASSRQVSPT